MALATPDWRLRRTVIFTLIGEHAYDYQIHASAYTPYAQTIDSKNLVQRLNAATLSIRWDNWTVPGCGMVAVVRRIVDDVEEGPSERIMSG